MIRQTAVKSAQGLFCLILRGLHLLFLLHHLILLPQARFQPLKFPSPAGVSSPWPVLSNPLGYQFIQGANWLFSGPKPINSYPPNNGAIDSGSTRVGAVGSDSQLGSGTLATNGKLLVDVLLETLMYLFRYHSCH